jgi:hypothetical protein
MLDEPDLAVQRAIVEARHSSIRADTTPAGTWTQSLPVIFDPQAFEERPVWRVVLLWWVCYLTVIALACYLSTLAWSWSPFAGGAAWGTTLQLALLPWRR